VREWTIQKVGRKVPDMALDNTAIDDRWVRLAEMLRAQRVINLRQPNRRQFVERLGLPNDRIISDLETAKRDNYDRDTLLSLEVWYQLDSKQLREVLGNDHYPAHDIVTIIPAGVIQSSRTKGTETEEDLEDEVRRLTRALGMAEGRLFERRQSKEAR
jgi:hypothetical protein